MLKSRDIVLEDKINSLMKKKRNANISGSDLFELEKEINELEDIKNRIIEKKKLHGVYGEGIINDINDSGAIPLESSNPNALFNANSIFYDSSPIINPYLSDEERKIEFLCCGIPFDKRASYGINNNSTQFKLHYIALKDGFVRSGRKLIGSSKKIIIHETRLGLGYASPDRTSDYYEKSIDNNNFNGKGVGYHFLCDADKIICFIPWDEVAFHASSEFYNCHSIGIERIVTEEAGIIPLYNQAKLIATLMYMENIPINRVITHFDATNTRRIPLIDKDGNVIRDENGDVTCKIKICPDRLLNGEYGGMYIFRQVIINLLRTRDLFVNELSDIKNNYSYLDDICVKSKCKYFLRKGE